MLSKQQWIVTRINMTDDPNYAYLTYAILRCTNFDEKTVRRQTIVESRNRYLWVQPKVALKELEGNCTSSSNSCYVALTWCRKQDKTQYTSHYYFHCFLISGCDDILLWRIVSSIPSKSLLCLLKHFLGNDLLPGPHSFRARLGMLK